MARGYRALKFDPFGTAWKVLDREAAEAAEAIVAAVREAVGEDIGLMIEFHGRLGAGAAAAMIRRLERFRPAWCEEPVAPECLELLAEVKRSAGCPIAAGERLYTQADFYRLTALRAVDVVQMDLAHCGGILAGKKIAAMAAAQDILVAPHCSIGPVALAACLHFDVCTPNFLIQEAFAEFDVPWRNDLVGGWNPIKRWRVPPRRRARPRPGARRAGDRRASVCRPTPSPACGTATGRRISRRTGEIESERTGGTTSCASSASR